MINDFTLCSLGLEKFGTILNNAMNKDENKKEVVYSYSFDDIMKRTYQVVPSNVYYVDEDNDGIYKKNTKASNLKEATKNNKTIEVKIDVEGLKSIVALYRDNIKVGEIMNKFFSKAAPYKGRKMIISYDKSDKKAKTCNCNFRLIREESKGRRTRQSPLLVGV